MANSSKMIHPTRGGGWVDVVTDGQSHWFSIFSNWRGAFSGLSLCGVSYNVSGKSPTVNYDEWGSVTSCQQCRSQLAYNRRLAYQKPTTKPVPRSSVSVVPWALGFVIALLLTTIVSSFTSFSFILPLWFWYATARDNGFFTRRLVW